VSIAKIGYFDYVYIYCILHMIHKKCFLSIFDESDMPPWLAAFVFFCIL
jgi:hypothetical protein